MSLAKPQMRGMLRSYARRWMPLTMVVSLAGAFAYSHFIAQPRIARYEEHFRTWNDELNFERMRLSGKFQGAPLDDQEEE